MKENNTTVTTLKKIMKTTATEVIEMYDKVMQTLSLLLFKSDLAINVK